MRTTGLALGALASLSLAGSAIAQNPATIPTVVAESMNMESSMFGRTSYFDGTPPTDWPKELVPAGARVLGGGSVGMMGGMRIQVTVFSFSRGTDPNAVLRDLLLGNGFRRADDIQSGPPASGFMTTAEKSTESTKYCKGVNLATFSPVDSARDPLVVAIHLMDGALALQSCNGRRDRTSMMMDRRGPVTMPQLIAPTGSQALGGGSSSSDGDYTTHTTVISSTSSGSLLSHYAAQLTAGGWKPDGAASIAGSAASQRFKVLERQEKWDATLAIISSGNRHQVMIYLTRTG